MCHNSQRRIQAVAMKATISLKYLRYSGLTSVHHTQKIRRHKVLQMLFVMQFLRHIFISQRTSKQNQERDLIFYLLLLSFPSQLSKLFKKNPQVPDFLSILNILDGSDKTRNVFVSIAVFPALILKKCKLYSHELHQI